MPTRQKQQHQQQQQMAKDRIALHCIAVLYNGDHHVFNGNT